MDRAGLFFSRGWVTFPHNPDLAAWVDAVRPLAQHIAKDPVHRDRWLRCGGTWFAGVNILPNDASGAVPGDGVPPLEGEAVGFVREILGLGTIAWDPAQISVCYPGYPQPWDGESDAAFLFRRDRDAAHVDGLTRTDPGRRRALGETHAFILGIPLTEVPADAAPLVVWEGSHEAMRSAFRERFDGIAPEAWGGEDITEAYVAARRAVFETCRRVPVHVRPGQAYLVHRLALHGVAPWGAAGGDAARSIAYFRPEAGGASSPEWWLSAP